MKEHKVYDSCFGRHYDANVTECKECEVSGDCRSRLIEYSKNRMGRGKEESLTNPFRQGTAMYVCYEGLKQGGTFKELEQIAAEELVKRKIKCVNVRRVLKEVLFECRKGRVHDGGKFTHNAGDKTYKIVNNE